MASFRKRAGRWQARVHHSLRSKYWCRSRVIHFRVIRVKFIQMPG